MLKEVSNVQDVSSLESTLEGGVESIVGEVSLEVFALWISWSPGSWSISRWGDVFGIEEGSVDNHGENIVS